MPRALTLQTNSKFVGSEINGTIEPHHAMGDLQITSEVLTTDEISKITDGNVTLAVTFQVTARDIFKNPYNQTFPFLFDHREGIFVRRGLSPEQKPGTNK